jgi:hypothetical protein
MAYSERNFYRYNAFHKFTKNEILSITEDSCKIFEKIIDEVRPDFLLMGITDLHRNWLFKELCQAKNISIKMLWPTRFADKQIISSDFDIIDNFDPMQINWDKMNYEKNFSNFLETNNPRKAVEKKFVNRESKLGVKKVFERHLKFLLYICNSDYRKFYENWGKTKIKFILSKEFPITYIIRRSSRIRFLNRFTEKNPDLNSKFIYFPLAHEPERTLLISTPHYTNQLEVISQIAKSIPIDYTLYVKEHYSMKNEAWRNQTFYKQILDLPNVLLIHPLADSKELMKKCSMVITINGTTALEAGFYGKPSVVFGDTSFTYLPFITRIYSYETLSNVIRTSLKTKFNFSTIEHYLELISNNSFSVNPMEMMLAVAIKIHEYNGLTREVIISEQKMMNFLKEQKQNFETLADEYISKIETSIS